MTIVIDGEPSTHLRWDDVQRAAVYGDGFFTTMRAVMTKVQLLEYHWQRIKNSCDLLGLTNPFPDRDGFELTMIRWIGQRGGFSRLRLSVWRASGGFYRPTESHAHWCLEVEDLDFPGGPTIAGEVGVIENVVLHPSRYSHIKGFHANLYVQAAREGQQRQLDDYVILNHEGFVADARVGTPFLFFKKTGLVYPPTDAGGVAGTFAQSLYDFQGYAKAWDIPIATALFTPADLEKADAVITANALGVTIWRNSPLGKVYRAKEGKALGGMLDMISMGE